MESEIYAYFQLIGMEFDPDEITTKLGIKPTEIWRSGDLITSRGTRRHKQNGWSVYSQVEKSIYLEDYIKSVLEQLQPGWLPLVELCKRYDAEISCVIYYRSGSVPAIHFDKYLVEMAHQLNAEIDVDFYVLPEEVSAA
ncbi:DUF4279 domain-containing protein [Kamptonema animale CS-326]|jgi:hypothetical protein|uniref:DUF4279 domain-containing protein n=1 Tax=Kamptonema animale TaxID=92934 RepID=UPI00232B6746|nr:DUF4279 domain-containing protein [Kamptonema animale]MDB9510391.1 DUF4279 domain-containing protein [Kamptonema animale CS-326]